MEQIKNKKVEVHNLSKVFFQKDSYFEVVKNVSFDVYDGEFLVLLGPGRCGKTVLLNMLIGTEDKTEGQIKVNNTGNSNSSPCYVNGFSEESPAAL